MNIKQWKIKFNLKSNLTYNIYNKQKKLGNMTGNFFSSVFSFFLPLTCKHAQPYYTTSCITSLGLLPLQGCAVRVIIGIPIGVQL